jgi:3-hydroxyacyl-CoA dehydrogenase
MQTKSLDRRALKLATPTTRRPFRRATVLGAGTMGAQIAAHLANAGLSVRLLDIAPDNADDNDAVAREGFETAKEARPDPFFSDDAAERVTLGNFEDDFAEAVGEADWVIEAVVERMDIKRQVAARIEKHARPDTVVSTNTSGLPIHEITEDCSADFRSRFLGTHFFNPPRYLKLLELVPTPQTDADVLERVAQFGRVHLGKGIVVANDVPYFVGNRIGVYGQLQAIRYFTDGEYAIEEIDTLAGPISGRPKSAIFRTADLVGLDVLKDVAGNLYEKLPDDESREAFQTPELLDRLVENERLGEKTKAGFYKKEDGEIKSVNPDTLDYESPQESDLDLERVQQAGDLDARLRALYEEDGRAGRFFRETTLDLLAYSARRIGEITDNPATVDRAIRWGFGWEKGPFEMWDAVGFETVLNGMREHDLAVPGWIETMEASGQTAFHRTQRDARHVYLPSDGGYGPDERPPDEISLTVVREGEGATIWRNDEASLLDLGDGVACFVFESKANTLGQNVIDGLTECIERVESSADWRGLVVGNEGKNFSVGANLGEIGQALREGRLGDIEAHLEDFQRAIQRVRYAEKPVVVTTHQRVLGGGCEMLMACPHPVVAAETYAGLVELGVGVIPAGTGSARLAVRAADAAPRGKPSEVQNALRPLFEQVAQAEVAESARQAQEMSYLAESARVVMHADRRLYAAKEEVLRLSNQGYRPPARRERVTVLGRPTRAAFEVALQQYRDGDFISDYDMFLGERLAYVMTGGDLSAPQEVTENYLLRLEREVFLELIQQEKTQDRIRHMLKNGKPLRN